MRFATLCTLSAWVGVAVGCGESEDPADGPSCDASADPDNDGLDDCAEATLGTDPTLPDTDGDGLTDGEEADCVSSPTDPDEQCYACGWRHADPGDLEPTGADEGDVVANLELVDQCLEEVDLHDFADQYTILFMTASWCGTCIKEAELLSDWQADYAASSGVPLGYAIVLFQDRNGDIPDGDEAAYYASAIASPVDVPVLSDVHADIVEATPFEGTSLPGRCLLSPQMEILSCKTGKGEDDDLYAVAEHHAG